MKKIIVVEDNPSMLKAMVVLLSSIDEYDVIGIKPNKLNSIPKDADLYIVDHNLGEGLPNGEEIIEVLKALNTDAVFIAHTSDDSLEERLRQVGADEVVIKGTLDFDGWTELVSSYLS